MSKETESIFAELNKYLENFELKNEADLDKAIDQFFNKYNEGDIDSFFNDDPQFLSADKFTEAMAADDLDEAVRLTKEALEIHPENVEATLFLISVEYFTDIPGKLDALNKLIKKLEANLRAEGYFSKEYRGMFWGVWETRPYMKARRFRLKFLIESGMYMKAIKEAEDLLNLSSSDNLGIRYFLAPLYGLFEDTKKFNKLLKKYPENTPSLLLSQAILNFKQAKFDASLDLFKQIHEKNPYLISYIQDAEEFEHPMMFSRGSEEEAQDAIANNYPLILGMFSLYVFLEENFD